MERGRRAAALAIGLALALGAGAAAADGWVRLGAREVLDRRDRDVIDVDRGGLRSLRLCVRESAVRVLDVKVRFGNGAVQDVAVRRVIPAGECTRDIDLAGGNRHVSAVSFLYEETTARRTRARVVLFGR